MADAQHTGEPDNTAVRTALWRALHVRADPPPHVLDDEIGLRLVDPADDWRDRPDMDPDTTRGFRAAMVARARFIEELVAEQADHGVTRAGDWSLGRLSCVTRDPDTGVMGAAANPRGAQGYAAGR